MDLKEGLVSLIPAWGCHRGKVRRFFGVSEGISFSSHISMRRAIAKIRDGPPANGIDNALLSSIVTSFSSFCSFVMYLLLY